VTFHATVAHRVADRARAEVALRERLREMTAGACAGTPDWSSLVIQGPSEVTVAEGRALYVWMATVDTTLAGPTCS
jgi:hypothetical protein